MTPLKKIAKRALVVCMLAAAVAAGSAKEVTIGKLKYKVNTTDKIAKCTGLAEEATKNYNLTIPSTVTYNGVTLKVTTVEKEAFWFDSYLKKVTLSDNTETIGTRAFASCDKLSIVSLGKKLKIIGAEAFDHCGNTGTFTSVKLPSTVEIIRTHAFRDCRSLVSVEMGDKVEEIGDDAFWNCEALKSIVIPGSVKTVGEMAFASCDELYEVTFKEGNAGTVIGEKCFDNLKKLKLVNFYGPGVVEIKDSAFIGCSIEWLSLPASVKKIGGGAFCGNNLTLLLLNEGLEVIEELAFEGQYGDGLRTLTIPSTVTTIGQQAFYGIGEPSEVRCDAVVPPVCGADVFSYNVVNYSDLIVPSGTEQRYRGAAVWEDFQYINHNHLSSSVGQLPAEGATPDADGDLWFDLSGSPVESGALIPGIYIVRHADGSAEKRAVR
ncbi:MAG: leucine-rich repeat domain-containing protein [Bacteroides sp.]|nr:leucine-rich repeat domain-containing protein [Bacteroides sp.]